MIVLESLPDGYLYSNILLKLYLRSLKYNGKLMFNDKLPYNSTILSNITRHNVGVVEKALQIFRDLGLIEVLDDGGIYMLEIQSFIGKSSTEADRKRKYRERIQNEKIKGIGQMSDQLSLKRPDKSTPEIEIEKEIEKEIDIDNKNIKNKPVKVKEIKHKYGEYKNVLLSDSELEKLKSEFPLDWNKRIETVSEYCASKGKSYSNYLATIRNWAKKENIGGDNNGKYQSNIKFNVPKTKINPGTRNLDEEAKKLGLI